MFVDKFNDIILEALPEDYGEFVIMLVRALIRTKTGSYFS